MCTSLSALEYLQKPSETLLVFGCSTKALEGYRRLEGQGYQVIGCRDRSHAVDFVREHQVKLVLIDSESGREEEVQRFVENILDEQGAHDDYEAPPFVLLSSAPSAPERSAKLGALAFLPKPYTSEELELILSRVFGHRTRASA